MSSLMIFLLIAVWLVFMLPEQRRNKVLWFVFVVGLILGFFTLLNFVGVIIGMMTTDNSPALMESYFTLPLSNAVEAAANAKPLGLAKLSILSLYILTLPLDLAIFVTTLAFSFKMPFLTVTMVLWMIVTLVIIKGIVMPVVEQYRRDAALGVSDNSEPFHLQVWKMCAEKQRKDAVADAKAQAAKAVVKTAVIPPLPPLQPGQARIVTDDAKRQFAKRRG